MLFVTEAVQIVCGSGGPSATEPKGLDITVKTGFPDGSVADGGSLVQ